MDLNSAFTDPDHEPSRAEFKLLKAVAAIAAVILQFKSSVTWGAHRVAPP